MAETKVTKNELDNTAGEIVGAWKSWSPSYSNLTVGAGGTVTAKYTQIGKTVHFYFQFTFGTGSAVGAVRVSLPVTATSRLTHSPIGTVSYVDATFGIYQGFVMQADTSNMKFFQPKADSTYIYAAEISSSIPMTWTTNDTLSASGTYEAA